MTVLETTRDDTIQFFCRIILEMTNAPVKRPLPAREMLCLCGFEEHAGLTESGTFLRENSDCELWLMAQRMRFEWDDYDWSENHTLTYVPKK